MAKSDLPTKTKSSTVGKTPLTAKQALARTQRFPQDPYGWKEHGRHLFNADDLSSAKAALSRASELDPEDCGIWLLLGYTQLNAGDETLAVQHFEHALSLQSDLFEAHLNLGFLYMRRNEAATSIAHIEKALSLRPENALALRVKAQLLVLTSQHEDAIRIYERLVNEDTANLHHYWNDLGNIKRELIRLDEALECYVKAAMHPATRPIALSNQITLLHYMPNRDPVEILDLCKKWGQIFTPPMTALRPIPRDRSPDKILRVGLISDGFRQHPVGAMITPAVVHLERYGVELFMYSSSSAQDDVTAKLKSAATKWSSIFNVSDDDVATRIRNDSIDILIDLSGHNAGTRMKAIASEPAPVIVKWVGGLINTTGVAAIDYLITDAVQTPLGSDTSYTEKLIRMPDDYVCYMPPARIPDVSALPSIRNGYITFGCFNNPTKVNDVLLGEWAKLLHAVPGSRLFLKGGSFGTQDLRRRTLETLGGYGIGPERIRMEGQSHHFDLLNSYSEVDIALDPWPYSGGLTTCEALLMGVPVITMPGPTFAGRHSATHLVHAGMPELIVQSWEEYRARASSLASDIVSLATIRSHLRRILLESPVCNGEKYARHLGKALRAIWVRYCEGRAPAALAFTAEGQPWFEDDSGPLTLTHPTPATSSSAIDFRFALEGKILALDHGATLTKGSLLSDLHRLGAFTVVVMDPASVVSSSDAPKLAEYIQQYVPNVALGDGEPATLYACLDRSLSGTQEPLCNEGTLQYVPQGNRVLARLPISTVQLDQIGGMEKLDWLILDERHDNLLIIQSARNILPSILVLQVRVAFSRIYKEQCDLSALCTALAARGFSLLRLSNPKHGSHFPQGTTIKDTYTGSQLISADAIFIPDQAAMGRLDAPSRQKLAFILHSVYQAPDVAHRVLALSGGDSADRYLAASGLAAPTKAPVISAPTLLLGKEGAARTFVGVPIYNEEPYIEQTIRSLIGQTCDGLRFLVSDNCSTDRTMEIVRDVVGGDKRFEVFQHDRNYGNAANLRFVFENTFSEYFMWLGGHDYLSSNYFEEVTKALDEDSGLAMVLGMPYAVQEAKIAFLQAGMYDFSGDTGESRYLDSVARLANCTIVQSVFRRKHLEDLEIRAVPSYDHILISHLLWKGRLGYASNAKYYRRYFPNRVETASARVSGDNRELSRADMYQYYLDDIAQLTKDLADPLRQQYLQETIQTILTKRFGLPKLQEAANT
ncbi:glycosyltransferase [Achromobacter sp. ACRQX]|uniref:O-linked N-acetylglucosamine transferase family protein n=1 Tax=Achromobacter sp. ACRQX TaxID=2918181 RepID=UPI001EF392E3|nr:glycosyltransferase [Achromobacter sp. ACRQX]MCG7325927.1 glycosyltransferase [Achromobacter sp. ACRQX]